MTARRTFPAALSEQQRAALAVAVLTGLTSLLEVYLRRATDRVARLGQSQATP